MPTDDEVMEQVDNPRPVKRRGRPPMQIYPGPSPETVSNAAPVGIDAEVVVRPRNKGGRPRKVLTPDGKRKIAGIFTPGVVVDGEFVECFQRMLAGEVVGNHDVNIPTVEALKMLTEFIVAKVRNPRNETASTADVLKLISLQNEKGMNGESVEDDTATGS